jgi:hypothetical protein
MQKRRGESELGFIVSMIFAIMAFIVGCIWGNNVGHEQGVRDALAGKYVVDTLSDGTTIVVKKISK